jgi:hypothetical protein
MKRLCLCVCFLSCLVALNRSCVAQANPWDGTWKLDASSLRFEGSTFRVVTDATGFTITRGGAASPKVVCDGKPQTTAEGMLICTTSGSGYAIEVKKDSKIVRKTTISISADGKTRTSTNERFPSNDKPFTVTVISKRLSGGPGMAGVWKESSFIESNDTGVMTMKVSGDSVVFKERDQSKPILCKLDGTPAKLDDTASVSAKLVDPHRLKVTYSLGGKVQRENMFVLSEDGKSIMETNVTPAPSPSTLTVRLHKS